MWCIVFFFFFFVVCCFFVQAEDGIRDLVRSRGLGDVYKRQEWDLHPISRRGRARRAVDARGASGKGMLTIPAAVRIYLAPGATAVSYTHLTLPTSDLV